MTHDCLISRPLAGSVGSAADMVRAELGRIGIPLTARIDHAAAAQAVGLVIPPSVVLIFGSPSSGTPLMIDQPTLAIELPLRMLFWEDARHERRVGYIDPFALADRHGMSPTHRTTLQSMHGLLERLSAVAQQG